MTKGVFVHSGSKVRFFPASSVYREPKLWGEEQWIVNKEYCGKKLLLKKDRRCSMHLHKEKDEVFYLQSGKVLLEIEGESYTMMPGDYAHIPPETNHRFTGLEDSEIMEFSTEHHEEDSYRQELSSHIEHERYERQSALLQKFSEGHLLVIGDVMLDCYTTGSVDRISPEAPIPVVSSCNKRFVPGGAANVGANITALKGNVRVLALCGDDANAVQLQETCRQCDLDVQFVVDASRKTTVKERVVDRRTGQQILRIDTEDTHPIHEDIERQLLTLLAAENTLNSVGAILLSDYAKGILTPRMFDHVYDLAERHNIPVLLDPKPHGNTYSSCIQKAKILKPNVREARALIGMSVPEDQLGEELSRLCQGTVILTRGVHGIDVCTGGTRLAHFDTAAREVVDVSGPGDTVLAVTGLCLAAGGSIEDAADIANRAAGVVVGKHGTATLSREELDAVL